jgi:hypothetical protein
MALIIPVTCSTFADACRTEGGPLCKYVLAQFRADADLAWVGQLRSQLSTEELKFKQVRENRTRLRQTAQLWRRVENGVRQATLVVIDPEPVAGQVTRSWQSQGAISGVDYNQDNVIRGCAAAIVAGTPIAHLPHALATVSSWRRVLGAYRTVEETMRPRPFSAPTDDFTPESIQQAIGTGLRSALVFAARAHATFDVASMDETARSTRDAFHSPLSCEMLREVLSTSRTFDQEDDRSAEVLNRASEAIAEHLRDELPCVSDQPLVQEQDSRAIDHLQAADIAAGWAREIIDAGGVRALGAVFERVWVNGFLMKGSQD